MSLATRKKIVKEAGAEPSELEEQVAQVREQTVAQATLAERLCSRSGLALPGG